MKSQSIRIGKQVAVHEMQEGWTRVHATAQAIEDLSNNLQLQRVFRDTGMGGLLLPFAPGRESLEEAMRRMRSIDRRALVVGYVGPDYRLSMNRSVLDARREGVVECGGLQRFADARVAVFGLEGENEVINVSGLSQVLFARYSADYALLFEPGVDDLLVYLLTRTDELAQAILTAAAVCECLDGHEYEEPPPVHGTLCQHDGTMIECV